VEESRRGKRNPPQQAHDSTPFFLWEPNSGSRDARQPAEAGRRPCSTGDRRRHRRLIPHGLQDTRSATGVFSHGVARRRGGLRGLQAMSDVHAPTASAEFGLRFRVGAATFAPRIFLGSPSPPLIGCRSACGSRMSPKSPGSHSRCPDSSQASRTNSVPVATAVFGPGTSR